VVGVTFLDTGSAPVPNFLNPDQGPNFFKFKNPPPVQIPATIDATETKQCFYIINAMHEDHADSCYCRKSQVTPDPGPKEKCKILPESESGTPHPFRHLCCQPYDLITVFRSVNPTARHGWVTGTLLVAVSLLRNLRHSFSALVKPGVWVRPVFRLLFVAACVFINSFTSSA